MNIQYLSQGDIFKHPLFNFNLKVSDTDDGIVQTEDMNPKTGEHIFFIGEQLEEEVTLVATKWGGQREARRQMRKWCKENYSNGKYIGKRASEGFRSSDCLK